MPCLISSNKLLIHILSSKDQFQQKQTNLLSRLNLFKSFFYKKDASASCYLFSLNGLFLRLFWVFLSGQRCQQQHYVMMRRKEGDGKIWFSYYIAAKSMFAFSLVTLEIVQEGIKLCYCLDFLRLEGLLLFFLLLLITYFTCFPTNDEFCCRPLFNWIKMWWGYIYNK